MAQKYMDYVIDSCEIITIELIRKIEETREECSILGVGVYSDEAFTKKEGRRPMRPYCERAQIISFIKGVDFVFEVTDETAISFKKEQYYYNNPKTKQFHIGYAPGTYDLLHQGHIEHLTEAYSQCDILVVGVNNDELVYSYKDKWPLMPAADRANIVSQLEFVDSVYIANELERANANSWIKRKYGCGIDAVFIGSDWNGQDLHNDEGLNIVFTFRDPEVMKTRSSTFYREEWKKYHSK